MKVDRYHESKQQWYLVNIAVYWTMSHNSCQKRQQLHRVQYTCLLYKTSLSSIRCIFMHYICDLSVLLLLTQHLLWHHNVEQVNISTPNSDWCLVFLVLYSCPACNLTVLVHWRYSQQQTAVFREKSSNQVEDKHCLPSTKQQTDTITNIPSVPATPGHSWSICSLHCLSLQCRIKMQTIFNGIWQMLKIQPLKMKCR